MLENKIRDAGESVNVIGHQKSCLWCLREVALRKGARGASEGERDGGNEVQGRLSPR
jgi:hypothetical protein